MMKELQIKSRIEIIDGFRCIAIILVILCHYYFRFAPPALEVSYYTYPSISFLYYGSYGVQFFFIISGFVISGSLESSSHAGNFLKKRFIRLFPSLLLCSVFTYVLVLLFDPLNDFPFLHPSGVLDFFPSLTILFPEFWNLVFHTTGIGYIDGVYWSLEVEIIFYIASALLYFNSDKRIFLKNWLTLTLIMQLLRVISSPKLEFLFSDHLHLVYAFCLRMKFNSWIYFSLGMVFYCIYLKQKVGIFELVIMTILVGMELYFIKDGIAMVMFIIYIFMFILFIAFPGALAFLKWRPIVYIGLVSYPLYLIHESVGVLLINRFSEIINVKELNILIPIPVFILMAILSWGIFNYYERVIGKKYSERHSKK